METTDHSNRIKKLEERMVSGEVLFAEIAKDLKSHGLVLGRIELQTTKTNGRVTAIEGKLVDIRVKDAEKAAISKHQYTGMKLTRDLIGILALAAALVKAFGC
jgi:hypothetical protein